jgi:hypothetical protein
MQCYAIDLDSRKPDVTLFSGEALQNDMTFFKANRVEDLADFDRKIFKAQIDAEKYLDLYNKTLKNLDNRVICKSRDLPAILLKRRYIVQTILGEKLYTERNYKKNWKPGQRFNFHDQIFFLTVELISITEIKAGHYRYDYKLIK